MPVRPPMAVPDLLRQRRVELGLTAAPHPLRPAWVVLGMGAGIGTVVVLIVLIVYWQLLNRERALQQTVARLTPLEQRLAKARSRLQKATTSADKLEQDTAKITAQLVSLRSGSAFLEQLRRVTQGGSSFRALRCNRISSASADWLNPRRWLVVWSRSMPLLSIWNRWRQFLSMELPFRRLRQAMLLPRRSASGSALTLRSSQRRSNCVISVLLDWQLVLSC